VGLSDHTLGNATSIAAVALGACIIEKHVTMDRDAGGPDDSFSLMPDELSALCRDACTAWSALGAVDYGRKSSERSNSKFRRSLYFVRAMKQGERITREDIRSVRPGYGLAPKYYDRIIGRSLLRDVTRHSPVSADDVELE